MSAPFNVFYSAVVLDTVLIIRDSPATTYGQSTGVSRVCMKTRGTKAMWTQISVSRATRSLCEWLSDARTHDRRNTALEKGRRHYSGVCQASAPVRSLTPASCGSPRHCWHGPAVQVPAYAAGLRSSGAPQALPLLVHLPQVFRFVCGTAQQTM